MGNLRAGHFWNMLLRSVVHHDLHKTWMFDCYFLLPFLLTCNFLIEGTWVFGLPWEALCCRQQRLCAHCSCFTCLRASCCIELRVVTQRPFPWWNTKVHLRSISLCKSLNYFCSSALLYIFRLAKLHVHTVCQVHHFATSCEGIKIPLKLLGTAVVQSALWTQPYCLCIQMSGGKLLICAWHNSHFLKVTKNIEKV